MRTLIIIASLIVHTLVSNAQINPKKRLNVFVDCSSSWCDLTYIRTEITVVDFVIDRIAADVHVQLTTQNIGSGGEQFQLIFYGLNKYAGVKDTLRFETLPLATDAEERELLVKYLQAGLAPYIAKSGYLSELTITSKLKTDSSGKTNQSNQNTKDKWNYWVFRAGTDGNFSSDQNYKSQNLNGRFSANRITDKSKILFSINGGENKNVFTIGADKLKVKNHNLSFSHTYAKSISQHWTVGYDLSALQSTFSNIQTQFYASPGIEYNIFPYKSVNTKLLTIRYGLDVRRNQYYDTTIYNKKSEWLSGQNISANLSLNQKWGNISAGVTYRNFFNNWRFYNISFNTFMDVRLTGNLSFNIYAFPSIVRDQVFLPKGNASADDILSRRRQLQTNYNFFMGFGITYRFGSILNNFVNPRFNSGEGNFFVFN
jgi:hypothetical protein